MKTNTKKTFFIVLCVCVIACVCGIMMKTTQKDRLNGNYEASGFVAYAYEEAESNVLGDTKYNISTNKVGDDNYLLIVTHLKNPNYVYELGYDFNGTYSVQEGDRASTNTYYTSITTLSNTTYYADDIFEEAERGDAMIVWEIRCNSTSDYTYYAYAKVGMLDGGAIYAYKDERIDTGKPYATAFYQVSIRIDENSVGLGSIDVTEISEVPHGAPVSVVGNKLTINGTTVTATPANDNYAFEMFIGHSATITEDTTILVSFTRAYTVTFENYDGTTLYSTKVLENEIPEYKGTEPEKKTVVSAYTFDGWDREIVAATADTTYTAQFIGGQLAYTAVYGNDAEWDQTVTFKTDGTVVLLPVNIGGTYTVTPASGGQSGTIAITWTNAWSGTDVGTYKVVNGSAIIRIYFASAEASFVLYDDKCIDDAKVNDVSIKHNGSSITEYVHTEDSLDLTDFTFGMPEGVNNYTVSWYIDGVANTMTNTAYEFATTGEFLLTAFAVRGNTVYVASITITVPSIYDLFAGTYTTNPSWAESVIFNSDGSCNLSPTSEVRGTYTLTPASENSGTIAITWTNAWSGTDTGTYAVVNGSYQVNIYLDNAATYFTLYNNSGKTVGSATLTYKGADYTAKQSNFTLSDELDLTQFGYNATGTYTAVYFIDGAVNAMTNTAFSFSTTGRHMISVYLYNGNNVAYSCVEFNVVSIYDLFAGTYTTNPSWAENVVFNSNGNCNLSNSNWVRGTYTLTPASENGGTIAITWTSGWSGTDTGTYAVVNGNYQVNIYLASAETYYTLYNNSEKTVGSATLTYNGADYTGTKSLTLSDELDLTKFGYSATGTYTAAYFIDGELNAMTDTAFSFDTVGRHMISVYLYNGNNVAYSYVLINVVSIYDLFAGTYTTNPSWNQSVVFNGNGTCNLSPASDLRGTYVLTPVSENGGTIAITWSTWGTGTDTGTYAVVNGNYQVNIYLDNAETYYTLYNNSGKTVGSATLTYNGVDYIGTKSLSLSDELDLTKFGYSATGTYTAVYFIDGELNAMTDTAFSFDTLGRHMISVYIYNGDNVAYSYVLINVVSIYDLFAGTYTTNPSWDQGVVFNGNGTCNLSNAAWVAGTYTLTPGANNGGTITINWNANWSNAVDTGTYAVVNGNYQVNIYLDQAATYYTLYNNSGKTVGSATLTYNGADYTAKQNSFPLSGELDLTEFGYSTTGTYTAVYFIDGVVNAMTDTAFSFSTEGRHMISVYLYNGNNVAYSYVEFNVVDTLYSDFAGTYIIDGSDWGVFTFYEDRGCSISVAGISGTYTLNNGVIQIVWTNAWTYTENPGTYSIVNGKYQIEIVIDWATNEHPTWTLIQQ